MALTIWLLLPLVFPSPSYCKQGVYECWQEAYAAYFYSGVLLVWIAFWLFILHADI